MAAGVIGLIASPATAGNHENRPDPGNGNASDAPGQNRVGVCHRTASASNRYIYIEVPEDEANGHITGDHRQHNQQIVWPADTIWRGTFHAAGTPVLDYFATSSDQCENTTTSTTSSSGGGGLLDLSPAVTFSDPDCDDLEGADWDGNLEAFLDYDVDGDVEPGETVTVEAAIEPAYANTYEFAPGAQTEFTHTFDDVTIDDCVLGEETVVPKPKPEPKPDDEPTVKGVEVVKPPAAAPTAVAAGLGDPTSSPLQMIAQMLVAGGMLLLVAGAWIGLGRREYGTHEA